MGKIIEAGERIVDWFDDVSERKPRLISIIFLVFSVGGLVFCGWLPFYVFSKDFGLAKEIIGMFFDFLGILLGVSLLLITTRNLIGNLTKREV